MSKTLSFSNMKDLLVPGKEVFAMIRTFTYEHNSYGERCTSNGTEVLICESKEEWLAEIEKDQKSPYGKRTPIIIKVPLITVKTVVDYE